MQCKSMMTLENRPPTPFSSVTIDLHYMTLDNAADAWFVYPLTLLVLFLSLFLLQTFCKPSAVHHSESSFVHNFELLLQGKAMSILQKQDSFKMNLTVKQIVGSIGLVKFLILESTAIASFLLNYFSDLCSQHKKLYQRMEVQLPLPNKNF